MTGMGMQQKDPLVHTLMEDKAIQKYGAMRIAEDLILLAIKDGMLENKFAVDLKATSLYA